MNNRVLAIVLSLALLLFFAGASALAQNKTNRILKQHNLTFAKDHLKQTEESLVQALQSNSVNMSSTAVQTIRELEDIFPAEPFSLFVEPLSIIIQNERADTQLRILSALALDRLHTDKGDNVIYKVAKNTTDESVRNICTALAIKSFMADEELSSK